MAPFWSMFGNIWATCYSNIWCRCCVPVTKQDRYYNDEIPRFGFCNKINCYHLSRLIEVFPMCGEICRNFASWTNYQKSLCKYLKIYLVFDKILNLLWQINDTFWANLMYCKKPNNDLAIWSHCN